MMFARLTTQEPRWIRPALLAALAIGLLVAPGCKSRRSAYRPVFVDPSPMVIDPAPSAPIGGVPIESEPPLGLPQGFEEGFAPSYSTPVPPPAEEIPNVTPPAQDSEPSLSPIPGRNDQDADVPSSVFPPQSRRDNRPAPPSSAERTALRLKVQSMADDPIDLVQPPKAQRPWRYVVLHHSAKPTGGHDQLDREHRENHNLNGCGYHFVIGNGSESPDGQIEVTRRWSEQKSGAYCNDLSHPQANEYGISICLIGDLDKSPPTAKQVETARLLVDYLQQRYAITADRVGTHGMLANAGTACPGRQFPADSILRRSNIASR